MNPPESEENSSDEFSYYAGVLPLDPALADRFSFLVRVPDFVSLEDEDRAKILTHDLPKKVNLTKYVKKTEELYPSLREELLPRLIKYVDVFVRLAETRFGYISARRAQMILENIVYVQAARIVLEGEKAKDDLKQTCFLTLKCSLAYSASKSISDTVLLSSHKQAYDLSSQEDNFRKKLALVRDPTEKLSLAIEHRDELSGEEISRYVAPGLAKLEEKKRKAYALIAYLTLRKKADMAPTAIETLAEDNREVFKPRTLYTSTKSEAYLTATKLVDSYQGEDKRFLNNLLLGYLGVPEIDSEDIESLYEYYIALSRRFNYASK